MERKALVLDIDGTLTNSNKEISPATGAGIRKVLESGHLVVLASGRPAYGMRRYAGELELKKYGGYLLSHNGARIVACGTGEVVYQKAVPGDLLPVLYEFAQKHDCGLATHSEDTVISAFAPDQYVRWQKGLQWWRSSWRCGAGQGRRQVDPSRFLLRLCLPVWIREIPWEN